MLSDFNMLIFYPFAGLKINETQIKKIKELVDVSEDDFDIISDQENFLDFDIKQTAAKIKNIKEKSEIFSLSKKISDIVDFSKNSFDKLSILGKALDINSKDTGFDFDLYDNNEISQYEFLKSVRKFSAVAAAIGFIPIIPFSDYTVLVCIQMGLLAKISSIYNYKLEPKEFLKMIFTTLGMGLVFKTLSKILCTFLPVIGWGINAAVAYAGTYALGILAKRYIEEDGNLTPENIKIIWEKSYEEGKKEFHILKEHILKKKNELMNEFDKYKNKNSDNTDNIASEKFDDIKNDVGENNEPKPKKRKPGNKQ